MKIDIHTHILPKSLPNLENKFGYSGWVTLEHHKSTSAKIIKDDECFRIVDCNCFNPMIRINECNDSNLDIQVLSTIPIMFNYWAKPEHTLYMSEILNDHISNVVQTYPERFIGLGTIPMQDSNLAIRELERCIDELKLKGIQIGTNINHKNLSDPQFFPIFEAAQDLGASIFVHPWDMIGNKQMTQYWLPWLVGMPAETSRAICSMIFGGVFERLPALRVAFAHGGGSFPATIGRIQHGYKVRPDLCAIDNKIDPIKYLGRFWVDSLVHDEKMLKYLIDILGNDKIALGTDYPFQLGELNPGKLIESSDIEISVKEKLLYKNALDWLGLPQDYFA